MDGYDVWKLETPEDEDQRLLMAANGAVKRAWSIWRTTLTSFLNKTTNHYRERKYNGNSAK